MFPKLIGVVLIVFLSAVYYLRRRDFPFALYLLLVSVFFSRIYWEVFGYTVRLEQLSCLLLFLTLIYDLLKKKLKLKVNFQAILVLSLFPMMLISSLWGTTYSVLSLKKSLIYVPYLLAFLALVPYLQKKGDLIKAWNFFYAAGCIALGLSVIGFYLFFLGIDFGMVRMEWGSFSLRGTFIIPNILGSTAVIIFVTAFMRLISKNEQKKTIWFDLVAMAIAVSGLMMSLTRAAWICGVVGILLGLIFSARRLALKTTLLGLAVMIATVGLTYLATTHLKLPAGKVVKETTLGEFGEPKMDRYWIPQKTNRVDYLGKIKETAKVREAIKDNRPFQQTLAEDQNYITMQRRIRASKMALQDWLSSPIIGRGTDSFLIENNNQPEYYLSSTWVTILHDWGLIAFLLHGVFLLAVFLGIIKRNLGTTQLSIKAFSSTLLIILILTSIMYQISTTMQLFIFWVLLAFFSSAASARLTAEPGPGGQTAKTQ
jgi:multisubunit Na+/H+ antiporter MnhF subunit